ncbi:ACP S-malonyltransferase [endosymbiont of unidentified scaly snail isolate Monju]|uniref:ACP S-malonyltransferase n=1 Tax=endosymbiont of unidentified scaly snail isolate Monju TaxID=1248727 RepID=UPI0003892ABB|nr:ACP S-malonyltransferase [endosymbiont of unidentified scaly snail isolate Monju]BAN69108.1 [acyl-carrier-protein] S-malonyltransferase [endosymbiont of unidentified scaly snail isolate Monju]
MSFAIVFPGQGSQSVGMLADLAAAFPQVRETFEEASDAIGTDLWALSQEGPAEDLNRTENTQPAMLSAGIAVWRIWQDQEGAQPVMLAGHSLGEYSALVAAGVLAFADAVRLVRERGRLMQAAVPAGEGAMAAILGLDDDQVRAICAEAAQGEVAEAVNFNSPGQVVIAGNAAAIARAVEAAKAAGARRALPLDVSVPSHCALMQDAAAALREAMNDITFAVPQIPVLHNVSVATADNPDAIRELLAQQLYSPVRWVETVRAMAEQGVDTLIEAGPGKVLSGLCKRIDKQIAALPVYDGATLDKALEKING